MKKGLFKKYDLDSEKAIMEIGSYFSLKKKIELEVQGLTKVVRRHKKAKRRNEKLQAAPDAMLNVQSEINKFKRGLLLKLHKEGEFSDTVIRQVEKELDIDELKLNLQLPKEK